jgi:HAD superfamily hydrolase (TIGR01509 family)
MKATVGKAFPKKSEEELKGIETGYVRDLLERLEKEAKPVSGAKEFLRECKKRKLRVAIASSAFGGYVNEMVEKIGLKEFFKVVVCAGDAKRGKPFPDLFLLAAEKLGVEPSKCLVVEDAVYGVIAAKRAGMKCAGITTTTSQKELKKAGADLVFSNYGKLPKLIFG